MKNENRIFALFGIIGAVVYAIADLFLYIGVDVSLSDTIAMCRIFEWRVMASMWIGLFGSLGLGMFGLIGMLNLM